MKIKNCVGQDIETNDLTDIEKMLAEKIEDFRLFCSSNNIQFILSTDAINVRGCIHNDNVKSLEKIVNGFVFFVNRTPIKIRVVPLE